MVLNTREWMLRLQMTISFKFGKCALGAFAFALVMWKDADKMT